MPEHMSDTEKRGKLSEMVTSFDTAMLVTRSRQGELRSRPLAIAEARGDGTFVFATSIESGKIHEVEQDSHVNVALQKGRQFVSVSGEAEITRDREEIDRLWKEEWKVWFPRGKDDASLCLLVVIPSEAEYWDGSGMAGMRFLFQAAKAYVSGARPQDNQQSQDGQNREKDDGQHAKVPLR